MLADRDLLEPTPAAWTPGPLANRHSLIPAPIPREWILEGEPVARNRHIAGSTDGLGFTCMWDCTAGRFNWFYGVDETVYLLEGSITVVDSTGANNSSQGGRNFLLRGRHTLRVDGADLRAQDRFHPCPDLAQAAVRRARGAHRYRAAARQAGVSGRLRGPPICSAGCHCRGAPVSG